ncbi:MAG: LacI family DNA-binding transcriptional regulator [Planctomycetota bacterium]|nr:LacI family DNA-binding transcriptional regulator [Planctomycetota bacterium]
MNQKDIARQLRISPSTVSMALRGEGRISGELREKILALSRKHKITIRERGPDSRGARAAAPTLRLGYCSVERPGSALHGAFRGMVERSLEQRHEVVLLSVAPAHGADLVQAAAEMKAQALGAKLDGLILDPLPELADAFAGAGLPQVLLGYYNLRPGRLDAVVPDNFASGYLLARELLAQGCRRIACVRCAPGDLNSAEKFAGYRLALEEAGLPLDPALIVAGDFTWMSGARCAERLAALPESQAPEAVLIENDWMTGQFVQGLRDGGDAGARALEHWALAHAMDARRETGLPREILRAELRTDVMGRLAARQVLDRIAGRASGEAVTLKVAPTLLPPGPKFGDRKHEFPGG